MSAHSPAIMTMEGPQRPQKRIIHWTRSAFAGVIGGALLITLEMFLLPLAGKGTMWDPVRLSASIALGNNAITMSHPFTFDIFFVGTFMHLVLSVLYAAILGLVIRRMQPPSAVAVGILFGLALYFFHFYGLASFYPWVVGFRNGIVIFSHLVFGASTAWIFSHLHRRQLLREEATLDKSAR